MRANLGLLLGSLLACAYAVMAASVPPPAEPKSGAPVAGTPTFEPGRFGRVQALTDPMIPGAVPTYYTPGYEQRARVLQEFVIDELGFCKKKWRFDLSLSLAVLDSSQWSRVELQLPYSMPSVTGEPPVALVLADWATAPDFFPKEAEAGAAVREAISAHGLSWIEANRRAFDNVIGHEFGHEVIDAYGIVPGTRWLNEMFASYVLYAYLQNERRDLLWLIDLVQVGNRIDRPQHHVSLDDFESMYMEILSNDGHNYGWYQGQFLEEVKKVYARHGLGFLKEVRAAFPKGEKSFALGNAETLRRLEKISSGFIACARSMDTQPKLPATP